MVVEEKIQGVTLLLLLKESNGDVSHGERGRQNTVEGTKIQREKKKDEEKGGICRLHHLLGLTDERRS